MTAERVAVVTGAAKGLGRRYALALAEGGYGVVTADVADTTDVAEEITDGGGAALAVQTDVSDETAVAALAEATLACFERVDVLVNNAAIFTSIAKRPFDEISVSEWDRMFAVNVRGTWLCTRAFAPAMRERGYGKVINVASMTVPSGIPLFAHYVASKGAIVALTRALARELGPWGICVNAISPDYVPHDPDYARQQPEMAHLLASQRCFRRDMVPDDLVGTLLYLAGSASDFVTGQDLWVNGGRLFN
jgi:3-oxoacyl-[acyl-carrier protein] reductase